MDNESCDVGLQKDEVFGWKLKVKGDCKEVLEDINARAPVVVLKLFYLIQYALSLCPRGRVFITFDDVQ